jgi:hypothetical protein
MEEKAEEKEEEVVVVADVDGARKKSGRKVGRQAQIIAVPIWTADQSSVLE